jgi:hypothetical protein
MRGSQLHNKHKLSSSFTLTMTASLVSAGSLEISRLHLILVCMKTAQNDAECRSLQGKCSDALLSLRH